MVPLVKDTDEFLYEYGYQFDEENNDYATDFSIVYYDIGGNVIRTKSVTGNTLVKYIDDTGTEDVNKIVITFTKTHNYNRRIRVTGITLGIYEEFYGGGRTTDKTIKTLSHKVAISPLMKEIPANDFSFTIDDTLANYNPENPQGIWKYTKIRAMDS